MLFYFSRIFVCSDPTIIRSVRLDSEFTSMSMKTSTDSQHLLINSPPNVTFLISDFVSSTLFMSILSRRSSYGMCRHYGLFAVTKT